MDSIGVQTVSGDTQGRTKVFSGNNTWVFILACEAIVVAFGVIGAVFFSPMAGLLMLVGLGVPVIVVLIPLAIHKVQDTVEVDSLNRTGTARKRRFVRRKIEQTFKSDDVREIRMDEVAGDGGSYYVPQMQLKSGVIFDLGPQGSIEDATTLCDDFADSMGVPRMALPTTSTN